ncbi:HEPN domain-containing protein [Candidatus Woesearchaeota archaeon]|nr:HEPN domain-containing protein [Candidatus Woesearchaeota archaeon]
MTREFEYYLEKNLAKRSVINRSLAKSLMEKAELRLKLLNEDKITDEMASIMFEEAYEAVREASQSLMQVKGFKPYSHDALIAFLIKEKLMPEQFIKSFDRYRILRNKSVYEAQRVSIETCKEALQFAKRRIPEVKNKLFSLLNSNIMQ